MPKPRVRLTQSFHLILVLVATIGISVTDLLLPQEIATDFLYVLPVLLCAGTGRRGLPYLVAAVGLTWTVAVGLRQALTLAGPSGTGIPTMVNDVFGIIAVVVLAAFISHRMQSESDQDSIIRFLDGRLQPGDKVRLHHMREMKRMMTLEDRDGDRRNP